MIIKATYFGKPIRTKVERGDAGLWYVTSPDVPGLLVAEQAYDDLAGATRRGLAELEAAQTAPGPLP